MDNNSTEEPQDLTPEEDGHLLPQNGALPEEEGGVFPVEGDSPPAEDDALPPDSPEEHEASPEDEDDALPDEVEDSMPFPVANPVGSFNLTFDGINVIFPYEPYESQKSMMERMILGINSNQNCLLESPTGTGKTAALLCASLAWLKNEREKNPGSKACVIYASRTHSKLQQVADQLKKTAYSDIPMVTLASRNQTCINATARGSTAIDDICELLRANCSDSNRREYPAGSGDFPACNFYKNFKSKGPKFQQHLEDQADSASSSSSSSSARPMQPWDIEDVISFGREHETCPYYEIHSMKEKAKLVLCNYNHLLHPWIRNAVQLEVKDNIVIFDEAHNIESTCMDIASRKISLRKLENTVIPALNEARGRPDIPDRKRRPLRNVEVAFTDLTNWLREQGSAENAAEFERIDHIKVRMITDPVQEFSSVGFSPENVKDLYEDLLILKDEHYSYRYDPVIAQFKVDASAIQSISSILFTFHTLFEKDPDTGELKSLEHYSVDVVITPASVSESSGTELSVLCLSPHVIFEAMDSARSVVVTSGTLSPIDSFSSELGLPFNNVLEAEHVVGRDRIFATMIGDHKEEGRNSVGFKFDFIELSSTFEEQAAALGDLLLLVCNKIRKGVLVFFPSKALAGRFRRRWETDGTLERLSRLKRPFFENDIATTEFKEKISEYRSQATSEGAIMFAFLRGRISEGIDFADDQARAVITVGIPFGPMTDLKIIRKRDYNDGMLRKYPLEARISGWDWYRTNAFRAMNQGLGRCVRHKDDWGVVLMVDMRCYRRGYMENLSGWVQRSARSGSNFEEIKDNLDMFLSRLQVSLASQLRE